MDGFIYPWVDDAEEGNEHATWTPITLIEKRKSMREQRGRGTKLDKVGDMLRDLSIIKVLTVEREVIRHEWTSFETTKFTRPITQLE